MPQQIINVGAAPNDGTGDPLRTAFIKTNENFTEVYDAVPNHEAAANPHPVYLTQAEADALYSVLAHNHDHGALTGLSDNDHPQYLLVADIDDVPVNGEVAQPISSNWAFDHLAAADPHPGYRLESADHNHQSTGAQAGQLDHGLALTGLTDDDHTQYLLASQATDRTTFTTNWGDLTDAGATTLHKHDHGGQDGLADDDHPQYLLLAGRSGGQVINGGTGINENLRLHATSNTGGTGGLIEVYATGNFSRLLFSVTPAAFSGGTPVVSFSGSQTGTPASIRMTNAGTGGTELAAICNHLTTGSAWLRWSIDSPSVDAVMGLRRSDERVVLSWGADLTANDIFSVGSSRVVNFVNTPTVSGTEVSLVTHDHDADYDPLGAAAAAVAAHEAFPVGSVFIAVVSTNPATLLGYGTWSAFAAGRVLVGLDSGQSEFDTVEETGGAKTHTLTTTEMPSHTHTASGSVPRGTSDGSNFSLRNDNDITGSETISVTVNAAGSGGAHNNLQPYIVVYMWKRTA